jgi:transposase-like protein
MRRGVGHQPAADQPVPAIGADVGPVAEFGDRQTDHRADATYVKLREAGRIVSVAVTVAVAVNTDGRREVLGMAIGASEAETFWVEFLRQLKRRRLAGVQPVISDAEEGFTTSHVGPTAVKRRRAKRMLAASELPSASLPIRDILFPALGTGRNPAECGPSRSSFRTTGTG